MVSAVSGSVLFYVGFKTKSHFNRFNSVKCHPQWMSIFNENPTTYCAMCEPWIPYNIVFTKTNAAIKKVIANWENEIFMSQCISTYLPLVHFPCIIPVKRGQPHQRSMLFSSASSTGYVHQEFPMPWVYFGPCLNTLPVDVMKVQNWFSSLKHIK